MGHRDRGWAIRDTGGSRSGCGRTWAKASGSVVASRCEGRASLGCWDRREDGRRQASGSDAFVVVMKATDCGSLGEAAVVDFHIISLY